MHITIPSLILNKAIAVNNISRIKAKADRNGCKLRPHVKTHQSAEIGKWFKAEGIESCAVSSMQMASYFAKAGWSDITVAFPFNILEINKAEQLASTIDLNICIESIEVANFITAHITHQIGVFVEVDAGYYRSGISANDFDTIDQMLTAIKQNRLLKFKGFQQHAGHTYHATNQSEVLKIHQETTALTSRLKERFKDEYPDLIISNGDTPTASICEDFEAINELRPGNFIFYDIMQALIGSCQYEDIAVAMACPVVAKYPERSEIVVYGGAVHFSKDYITAKEGHKLFGLVAKPDAIDKGWSAPIKGAYLKKLSQEHGTIHATPDLLKDVKLGDMLYCLPIHSCLTANLMKGYLTTEGKRINMFTYDQFD